MKSSDRLIAELVGFIVIGVSFIAAVLYYLLWELILSAIVVIDRHGLLSGLFEVYGMDGPVLILGSAVVLTFCTEIPISLMKLPQVGLKSGIRRRTNAAQENHTNSAKHVRKIFARRSRDHLASFFIALRG
jgi:hypothetical protein